MTRYSIDSAGLPFIDPVGEYVRYEDAINMECPKSPAVMMIQQLEKHIEFLGKHIEFLKGEDVQRCKNAYDEGFAEGRYDERMFGIKN
jgi:hypothetical protein